jgi:hypothetical protein
MVLPCANAQDAKSLRSRYVLLREQLSDNQFERPLVLESSESDGVLYGDVYAQIDKPYELIAQALQGTGRWCDILILHLNVKGCRASASNAGESLNLHVGRKYDQRLDDAYAFDFHYKALTVRADYLHITLQSPGGPLGTSDYRVTLELAELDDRRSFLHLSYTYRYGLLASVAMKSYLATGGRNKVGFSIAGRKTNGQPKYVGGVRGMMERNTMRYYLAIESYLGAPEASPQQLEKRLNDWYSHAEQYPLQLHEMQRSEYLRMKHKELARQKGPANALTAPG